MFSWLSWAGNIDDGLIAHWTFDDPSNLGKDSISTNTGTVSDGAFAFGESRVGSGALAVDGVKGHIEVPDSEALRFTATDSYSVSLWAYPAELPNAWSAIISKSRTLAPWYGIWISGDNWWTFGTSVNLGGEELPSDSNGNLIPGWHHIVVTQDGSAGQSSIYVDGVQMNTGDAHDVNGNGVLWIGGATGVSEYFHGLIDDVRIYNRSLADSEVAELANVSSPSTHDPLKVLVQPQDNVVFPNSSATLNAMANQLNLTFQWYRNGEPYGASDTAAAGVAAPMNLTMLTESDNGTTYYVTFTDADGNSVTSRVATIIVQAATGIDSGLVGHWTFDDPANLGKDLASTNSGVVSGGAYAFGNGRIGAGALAVDGVNGHIEIADTTDMRFTKDQMFTLSAWIYPAELNPSGAWRGVVTKSRNTAPWYGIWVSGDNTWAFGAPTVIYGSALPTDGDGNLTPGWHHVVVTQDGSAGQSSIYVDGVSAATGAAMDVNGGGPLWIGGAVNVSEYFNGLIDDVRLYKRVLTDDEISQLYSAASPSNHLALQYLIQPNDQSAIQGQPVSFTVSVNLTNTTCQWYKNNTAFGSAGKTVLGGKGAVNSLTLSNVALSDDGAAIFAVALNGGISVTSQVVHLTVKAPVDGLIAHYTFDSESDLGADSGMGLCHGTVVGGATFSNESRLGTGALYVDGVNGHIVVPDAPYLTFNGTNSFTVSVWFQAQTKSGWGGIVTKGRNTSPWYGIWRDPDGPRLFSGSAETWPPTEPVLTDGVWHHAAIVQDATNATYTVYCDGVDMLVPFNIPATTGAGDLWIGGADNGEYFKGLIDEVRIYDRALSVAEISNLANPVAAPTLGLVRNGATLVITYTGTLQSADSISGQWTDVTSARSPFSVTPTGSAKFYRARQ